MRRFTILLVVALVFTALLLVRSAMADATFTCLPGATYTLKGSGPPNTALLLHFDGRPVGGGTTDANGAYRVRLAVGQEPPGSYDILLEVRETHQRLASATCIIPAPDATQGVLGAPKEAPRATPTVAASSTVAPSLVPNASTTATRTSTVVNSTATSTPTATTTGSSTTTGTPATATSTTTGTQATSTATTTGTPATATSTSTTTATPTVTATDDPSDNDPSLDIGPDDDDPIAGQPFVLSGSVTDSNGDGIANVTVTVTYKPDGGSDSAWCTATTTSPDGDWKCNAVTISADLKDKHVTWTGTIVVNGRTVTEEYDETVGES